MAEAPDGLVVCFVSSNSHARDGLRFLKVQGTLRHSGWQISSKPQGGEATGRMTAGFDYHGHFHNSGKSQEIA
jgi:hypothetical protein